MALHFCLTSETGQSFDSSFGGKTYDYRYLSNLLYTSATVGSKDMTYVFATMFIRSAPGRDSVDSPARAWKEGLFIPRRALGILVPL
jgi:hypothetical protein